MKRNVLIVVGGLVFGLIVGILAPSMDFRTSQHEKDQQYASELTGIESDAIILKKMEPNANMPTFSGPVSELQD